MPIVKVDRAKALADIASYDWTEFDAMTDEDIARQVAENPDAAPLLAEDDDLSGWISVRGRPPSAARKRLKAYYTSKTAGRVVEMAALRGRLGLTQEEFARTYGFSSATVRSIEQGIRKPSGPTTALLKLIDKDPDFVREALGQGS